MPVPGRSRFPIALAALILFVAAVPALLAAEGDAVPVSQPTPSYILIGFVGGFVRHDNAHHGPVQFAERSRQWLPKDAHLEMFENRHRKAAFRSIVRLLDSNHDGVLSAAEKSQARIILFGHSWGAAAAVMLARELDRAHIPVLLTVQVDSIAKPWDRDGVIPENVAEAVNFYQPHGILHGRTQIRAADQSKTQILGNYRVDYKQAPVQCEGYNWLDRTFTRDHMQSDCDPKMWREVESLVRQRIEIVPSVATAAVQSQPHP
jgi:pimeloyl-ACP methyl ester carboxylesterase